MEKNALGALILENQRQLYRIAKSILRKDEDCSDAAQEAILKAFKICILRGKIKKPKPC